MKYAYPILLIILLILFLGIEQSISDVTSSNASSTQTNTSGSNTNIQGYEAVTNYNSGSNPVTTNTTNHNSSTKTAVSPSNAPSMSVYGQKSCVTPVSLGASTIVFAFSAGKYFIDEECQRRQTAQLLSQVMGMKVAGISLLCDDPKVFEAMLRSGTPCPVLHNGKSLIGEEAMKVILESRKEENSEIELYRKYKESLRRND